MSLLECPRVSVLCGLPFSVVLDWTRFGLELSLPLRKVLLNGEIELHVVDGKALVRVPFAMDKAIVNEPQVLLRSVRLVCSAGPRRLIAYWRCPGRSTRVIGFADVAVEAGPIVKLEVPYVVTVQRGCETQLEVHAYDIGGNRIVNVPLAISVTRESSNSYLYQPSPSRPLWVLVSTLPEKVAAYEARIFVQDGRAISPSARMRLKVRESFPVDLRLVDVPRQEPNVPYVTVDFDVWQTDPRWTTPPLAADIFIVEPSAPPIPAVVDPNRATAYIRGLNHGPGRLQWQVRSLPTDRSFAIMIRLVSTESHFVSFTWMQPFQAPTPYCSPHSRGPLLQYLPVAAGPAPDAAERPPAIFRDPAPPPPPPALLKRPAAAVNPEDSTASGSDSSSDWSSDSSSSDSEAEEAQPVVKATAEPPVDYVALKQAEEAKREGWELSKFRLLLWFLACLRGGSLSEVVAEFAPHYPHALRTIQRDLSDALRALSACGVLCMRGDRYHLCSAVLQPSQEEADAAMAAAKALIAEEERNIMRGLGVDSVVTGQWSAVSWELSRLIRAALGLRGATENQILRSVLPLWCGLLRPDSSFCFPPIAAEEDLWERYLLPHLVAMRAVRRGDLYAMPHDAEPPSATEIESLRRECRLRMLSAAIFGSEQIPAPVGVKVTGSQPVKIKLRRRVALGSGKEVSPPTPPYNSLPPVAATPLSPAPFSTEEALHLLSVEGGAARGGEVQALAPPEVASEPTRPPATHAEPIMLPEAVADMVSEPVTLMDADTDVRVQSTDPVAPPAEAAEAEAEEEGAHAHTHTDEAAFDSTLPAAALEVEDFISVTDFGADPPAPHQAPA